MRWVWIKRLAGIVESYSDDIKTRFDLDKYGVLVMEKEVRKESVRTGLHSVEKIGEID